MTAAENPETTLDAYALLSKPTLDLTDAEVEITVADLRRRRELYLKSGKADRPAKPKKAPARKASDDEKRRNTELLMAQLKLGDN